MAKWVLSVGDLFEGLQVVSIPNKVVVCGATICTPQLSDGSFRLAWYSPSKQPDIWPVDDDEIERVIRHAQQLSSITARAETEMCCFVVEGIAADGQSFRVTCYFGHSGQRYADHLEYLARATA